MRPIIILLLVLCSGAAWGAVPLQIGHQGFLTNTSGSPLDTVVSMTFRLYNSVTGGTPLWTETQPSCTVRAGTFSVLLGSVVAVPDSFSGTSRWLGTTVGNNSEMTPRTKLVSVPYAYRVGTVDGASGGTIIGKLNAGTGNTNTGTSAFVFGENSAAGGSYATASGGISNTASGYAATTCGGQGNIASYSWAVIGGGYGNTANGNFSTVNGGSSNLGSSTWATVGGGGSNAASGVASTVGGGYVNFARGDYTVVSGGGGGSSADSNSATGSNSTIGGGRANVASGTYATVAGGSANRASGGYSATVSGGASNIASGQDATVCGGYTNTASGNVSTVCGGTFNVAAGAYSFAAGRRAKANYDGCFRWADSYNADFSIPDTANSFSVRATGGVHLFTNATLTSGAHLYAGSSTWNAVSDSTLKRRYGKVDTKEVLDKVATLPIERWSYKAQDESVHHIGPMAQDFWRLFRVGDDSLSILTIDPDGIALAAIQELAKRNEKLEEQVARLTEQVQTLMAAEQHTSHKEK